MTVGPFRMEVVEPLRRAERANRLCMIEPESQHHALVEIALRAGVRGRDFAMVIAHAVEQRRAGQLDQLGLIELVGGGRDVGGF